MSSIDTKGFGINNQGVVSIPGKYVSIQTLAVAKVMIFGKMYRYTSMSIDTNPWSIDTGL